MIPEILQGKSSGLTSVVSQVIDTELRCKIQALQLQVCHFVVHMIDAR
jgi:hypothetical protein